MVTHLGLNRAETLVLTANRRLANALLKAYAEDQAARGLEAWASPQILPLQAWLTHCWDQGQSRGLLPALLLLTAEQELRLWEQIIRESNLHDTLLNIAQTAKSASSAWHLLQNWRLDPWDENGAGAQHPLTEDAKTFRELARTFLTLCEREHYVDSARAHAFIIEACKTGVLPLPAKIVFTGFDEFSPSHEVLIAALRQYSQVEITETLLPNKNAASSISVQSYADTEQELLAMAGWAQRLLAQGLSPIACIIPNLTQIRGQVEKILTRVLAPEHLLPGHPSTALPFNIAGGVALSHFPLVHAALYSLALSLGEHPLNTYSPLLRTPFIQDAMREYSLRARLDSQLREVGCDHLNLIAFHHLLRQPQQIQCTGLLAALESVTAIALPAYALPSLWAAIFSKQLLCWGWPGERILQSADHQILQRFQKLLADLALYDHIEGPLEPQQALKLLQQLADQTLFQAKQDAAPLQVLGVLEATGQVFATTWVLGLHDGIWPTAPAPHPFIPLQIQRLYNMPHSSSARETHFCAQLTTRLSQSAPEVIFSYPLQKGDEALRMSPLLKTFNQTTALSATATTLATQLQSLSSLEYFSDDYGPAINEHESVSGGSSLFKDQAACPFRAFARHRLGAYNPPEFSNYMTALDRGKLIHFILEKLWTHLRSQSELLALPQTTLLQLCDALIIMALNTLPHLQPKFRELEQIRLRELLWAWLEQEKARPAFTVLANEQNHRAEMGGIQIRMQIDRIDQVGDEQIMIDYKTGKTSIKAWLGTRPDDPQLPLYTVTSETPMSGAVFAKLKKDELYFQGIAKTADMIPGVAAITDYEDPQIPASWNELLISWRFELEKIAMEFRSGYAAVNPKYGSKTCEHCDLPSLCHVK